MDVPPFNKFTRFEPLSSADLSESLQPGINIMIIYIK